MKHLRGPYGPYSRKDLTACGKVLLSKINKGLEPTIDFFNRCIKDQVYIPYTKHLTGLSHHAGLGSARRPYKCYHYIAEFLKGFRGYYKYRESLGSPVKVSEVLVNCTTDRLPKGVRKASRGRRFKEEARKYNLVLVLN